MGGKNKQNPARQLSRSHGKILEKCDLLVEATEQTPPNLALIYELLAFFSHQTARHEEDEEESCFPRIASKVGADVIETLTMQHRAHAQLVSKLENLAESTPVSRKEMESTARELANAYQSHIELEENTIIPATGELTLEDRKQVSREMQARRGR